MASVLQQYSQLADITAHPNLIRRLFELETPEIAEGQVEIRNIAREAGSRSKMAVRATMEGIDPVGACVGPPARPSPPSGFWKKSGAMTRRRR